MARGGAVPAAACRMLRHPSLIDAALVELANCPGVAPAAVPFAFRFGALSLLLRVTPTLLQPLSSVLGMRAALRARVADWTPSPGARTESAVTAPEPKFTYPQLLEKQEVVVTDADAERRAGIARSTGREG